MLYQHPEYVADVAAERYRSIRESFLSTPRMQPPRLLQQSVYLLGWHFVRLGRSMLRYGLTRHMDAQTFRHSGGQTFRISDI